MGRVIDKLPVYSKEPIIYKQSDNLTKEYKMNEWEEIEEHIHRNLGFYGLDFLDKFLEVKEYAEDLGLCPRDTPERQDRIEEITYG